MASYSKEYETRRVRREYRARVNKVRVDNETRTKICQACCNLPHVRPLTGCPPRTLSVSGKLLSCGLPYRAEEPIEAHVGGFSLIYAAQKYASGGGPL